MSVRCIVLKNCQDHGDGVMVAVPTDFSQFLKISGDKLKIKAEKAFSATGGKIDDVALIREDEKIFISSGESFFKDKASSNSNSGGGGGGSRSYKVAVIGSGGVGKSCLSMRYVRDAFMDIYDPTIEDAFRHQTVVDGIACMIDILDTAGQEDMKMLRKQWIEDRDGFLLAFSITERGTFEECNYFWDLIVDLKGQNLSKVPLVLVGNKADLDSERHVKKHEGEALAAKYNNAKYLEASAKTGLNVNECFEALVKGFLKNEPSVGGAKKKKPGPCSIL